MTHAPAMSLVRETPRVPAIFYNRRFPTSWFARVAMVSGGAVGLATRSNSVAANARFSNAPVWNFYRPADVERPDGTDGVSDPPDAIG